MHYKLPEHCCKIKLPYYYNIGLLYWFLCLNPYFGQEHTKPNVHTKVNEA